MNKGQNLLEKFESIENPLFSKNELNRLKAEENQFFNALLLAILSWLQVGFICVVFKVFFWE